MRSSVEKVVVEVSIDAELKATADRTGTDLSQAAEAGIRRVVETEAAQREERRQAWQTENAEAFRSYNEYVRKNGLPLAKHRMF